MKHKLFFTLVVVIMGMLTPASVSAKNLEIPLDVYATQKCVVDEPCHIEANIPITFDTGPYTFTYDSSGAKNFITCVGPWGFIDEGRSASCLDDDVGHGFFTFQKTGNHVVRIKVIDSTGNKGSASIKIEVSPQN